MTRKKRLWHRMQTTSQYLSTPPVSETQQSACRTTSQEIPKYTWTSPNGRTRNQIDHICISRKWRRSLMDVSNKRGASIDSDHELVVGELSIKLRRKNTVNGTRNRPPLNVHRLGDPAISSRMATTLRERLMAIQPTHPWEQTCRTLRNTAEELLGTRQPRRIDWITTRTWDLINKRNTLKSRANHDSRACEEHSELCKMVKKSARNDKRALLNSLADKAERAANTSNMRLLYQLIGKLSGCQQIRQIQPVRDSNGALLTDDDAQTQRWRRHFMELSCAEQPSSPHEEDLRSVEPINNIRISPSPSSVREIRDAIRKLKSNKAAGDDGIPAELLQTDSQLMAETLHPHFEDIWENERVPKAWK